MNTLKNIQTTAQQAGVKALTNSQLFQLLGINQEECDLRSLLTQNKEQILKTGCTLTTAIKIDALGEIAQRYEATPRMLQPKISSSADGYKHICGRMKHLSYEECWVMYLNRANMVIATERLSIGGVTSTIVDVKLIVKRALELLASSMILVHNHPSGNASPGGNDKIQTKILKDAANLFDISLLDHLIVAGDSYFSFADDGII